MGVAVHLKGVARARGVGLAGTAQVPLRLVPGGAQHPEAWCRLGRVLQQRRLADPGLAVEDDGLGDRAPPPRRERAPRTRFAAPPASRRASRRGARCSPLVAIPPFARGARIQETTIDTGAPLRRLTGAGLWVSWMPSQGAKPHHVCPQPRPSSNT